MPSAKALESQDQFSQPPRMVARRGATWAPQLILPGEDAREGALIFTNQKMGVLRAGAKMFRTTDGGQTWTGAIGQIGGKPEVKFADDNVGWAIAYQTMMYTTDGGQKWTSRKIAFPASVNAFILAGKDNGYVVGDHGMVYRVLKLSKSTQTHLHRFRDSAAIRWLRAGIDVRTVQEWVGHESLATTQKILRAPEGNGKAVGGHETPFLGLGHRRDILRILVRISERQESILGPNFRLFSFEVQA
jgi:Phage integrase family